MPTGGFGKIKSKPPAPAAPEERYLCAACGGHDIGATTVKEGVVEDMTTVRHVIGQLDWQPRPIATVNIDGGARILAGLLDDAGPNDRVTLFEEDGAPYARRKI